MQMNNRIDVLVTYMCIKGELSAKVGKCGRWFQLLTGRPGQSLSCPPSGELLVSGQHMVQSPRAFNRGHSRSILEPFQQRQQSLAHRRYNEEPSSHT